MQAAARAHANIALIKYWGKRDGPGNLPATGSISVTLDALFTDTSVAFLPHLSNDEICLESGGDTRRVSRFVDLVRRRAGMTTAARVHSRNSFPTSAGLASSASAFAALALAACHAAGLSLSVAELSALARQGSGSAARSLFGGYVEMRRGGTANGQDAHAVSLCAPTHWPLAMVIAITSTDTKTTGSSKGMAHTAATSPYYPAWLDGAAADLDAMRAAIAARDLTAVGELTEHSCLKMHALMLSARPALLYWNPATVAAWQAVQALRAAGAAVYATMDAGPQVKALCRPEDAAAVAAALEAVPGVIEARRSALGPDAHFIDDPWG